MVVDSEGDEGFMMKTLKVLETFKVFLFTAHVSAGARGDFGN